MGLGPKISKSVCDCSSTQTISPGNPDPNNYEILRAYEYNNNLLVEIKYRGCTNYEGKKILVYMNFDLIKLVNQKLIDPHFSQSKTYRHPTIRIVPNEEGWELGKMIIGFKK